MQRSATRRVSLASQAMAGPGLTPARSECQHVGSRSAAGRKSMTRVTIKVKHATRGALLSTVAAVGLLIGGGSSAAAPAFSAAEPPLDENKYRCIDNHLCLFDGNGGPWGEGTLTFEAGRPGLPRPIHLRPLGNADWASSYTNNTGREVWFYDHPDCADCATLVHKAAPHSRGLLAGAADNTTDIIVRTDPGASRVMPCPEARPAPRS